MTKHYRQGLPESQAIGSGEPGPGTRWTAYLLVTPQMRGVRLGTVSARNATEAKAKAERLYQVTGEDLEVERC